MCLNAKYVYNRYINRYILTDCGKCEACLQKKASARANRIRYHIRPNQIAIFFTLTYDNSNVPYIDLNDYRVSMSSLSMLENVPIKTLSRGVLGTLEDPLFLYPNDLTSKSPTRYRTLNGHSDGHIGVCWYKDIQDFFKRLRINLKRHYNYDKNFSYFSCSEYGGKTLRPHFHGLLFTDSEDYQIFKCAIVESWPYADCYRTEKFIEIARDCAGYVASYVNGNNFVSRTFSGSCLRQKHSYSQGFGVGHASFELKEILKGIDRGALQFDREIVVDGISCRVSLPIPTYVINRYFPKFKGFSRLPVDSLYYFLREPAYLELYKLELDYSSEDLHKIEVMLNNSFARYHAMTGRNRHDYALDYLAAWRVHFCTSERLLHEAVSDEKEYETFYEEFPAHYFGVNNNADLSYRLRTNDRHIHHYMHVDLTQLPHRIKDTMDYARRFRFRTKQKMISHTTLSQMGYFV